MSLVDSGNVFWNAPHALVMGLGMVLALKSNQHKQNSCRGPVGLDGLLIYKYSLSAMDILWRIMPKGQKFQT